MYNTVAYLQTLLKQSLVSSGVLFVFPFFNDKSFLTGTAPRLGPCQANWSRITSVFRQEAMEMSNAAKQRVVTMAQQRMLAVAASKEAMRGYLQNGQVLLLDAYKEWFIWKFDDYWVTAVFGIFWDTSAIFGCSFAVFDLIPDTPRSSEPLEWRSFLKSMRHSWSNTLESTRFCWSSWPSNNPSRRDGLKHVKTCPTCS